MFYNMHTRALIHNGLKRLETLKRLRRLKRLKKTIKFTGMEIMAGYLYRMEELKAIRRYGAAL